MHGGYKTKFHEVFLHNTISCGFALIFILFTQDIVYILWINVIAYIYFLHNKPIKGL